jgi:hypothetical protein
MDLKKKLWQNILVWRYSFKVVLEKYWLRISAGVRAIEFFFSFP